MLAVKPYLVLVCVALLFAPATFAADPPQAAGQDAATHGSFLGDAWGWLGQATSPYRPKQVPLPDLSNSGRLESLMRAGNIYLSLQDCIALALENNLDIEIQRYVPQLANAAVLQTLAGGGARAVSTSVTAGPLSAAVSSTGTPPGTTLTAIPQAAAGAVSSGPAIPNLDPTLTGGVSWAHATTPQSSAFVTGTNSLITRQDMSGVAIQKGFLSGTLVSLGLSNSTVTSNSMRNDFNPATSGALSLNFTQHLLQGFGWGLNSRQIRIARNNLEVSDLTFKLQVITTVTAVMELYWDLVAFNESARVAEDALSASQKLLIDNQRQVEVGTLAPIEVVRAEAEIAAREQNLLVAQTQVLQQETIIKSALSRTGVASPAVADAHIIPTDRIEMPGVEPIAPIQELTATAIASRPELAQTRIQLRNQELTMKGSKNALRPTLDVVASLANNALAGGDGPQQHAFLHRRLRHSAGAAFCAQLSELLGRFQPERAPTQPCGAGPGNHRRADLSPAAARLAAPREPGESGRAERGGRPHASPRAVPGRGEGSAPSAGNAGRRAKEAGGRGLHHVQRDPHAARPDHRGIQPGDGRGGVYQIARGTGPGHRPDSEPQRHFAG